MSCGTKKHHYRLNERKKQPFTLVFLVQNGAHHFLSPLDILKLVFHHHRGYASRRIHDIKLCSSYHEKPLFLEIYLFRKCSRIGSTVDIT